MNPSTPPPAIALQDTVRWLAAHARFPASRLEPDAELMVCISVLAARAVAEERRSHHFERRVGAQTSAQRQHALRRSRVHFKCDNSAKV
jgi:hypothetical protein